MNPLEVTSKMNNAKCLNTVTPVTPNFFSYQKNGVKVCMCELVGNGRIRRRIYEGIGFARYTRYTFLKSLVYGGDSGE